MFQKILIATRGEIACRIARTCHRLGVAAATVHTAADRNALHVSTIRESVEVAGNAKADGYLNINAILEAAHDTGAQAVHPGIGFLAEHSGFAAAVERAGLTFIGPRPDTLIDFGDKISAKREAKAAGLPVLEGNGDGFADADLLEDTIRGMELPVLLKAVFGGGGRGVRVIHALEGLAEEVASAMREAENAFGRPDLMVERFFAQARHVEVQIAGDGRGGVVHLFERECSLQRRYQKIVEESPAPNLPGELAGRLWADACRLGTHARFRNLGTFEFLVSGHDYYFLECNPRLQVEHTVTEMVTGLDLVELQLKIAAEAALNLRQEDIVLAGHAIQARLYAEDPANGFAPSTGPILLADFPANTVRVDAGVEAGSQIGPHYDPLVAKLISLGKGRREALGRLRMAIADTAVLGVTTNLSFLETLLAHPAVVAGEMDTQFIEREWPKMLQSMEVDRSILAIAAYFHATAHRSPDGGDPWSSLGTFTGWRLSDGQDEPPRKPAFLLRAANDLHEVSVGKISPEDGMEFRIDGEPIRLRVSEMNEGRYRVSVGNNVMVVRAVLRDDAVHLHGPFGSRVVSAESFLAGRGEQEAGSGHLLSPMMGRIIRLNVRVGDSVKADDVLALQDSMKMEFSIRAPWDGIVTELACEEDEMVERHSHIITMEPLEVTDRE
jgi:3-methylcrotonyl-CoA carboxylase alpha subunit